MGEHERDDISANAPMSSQPADSPIVWLTVPQAAARAQCGDKIIYRAVTSGRLRAARIGGRRELRIRPEWVDAWLEACAQPLEIVPGRRTTFASGVESHLR